MMRCDEVRLLWLSFMCHECVFERRHHSNGFWMENGDKKKPRSYE